MKLYYSPGACSLAAHIVAREASVAVDLVRVDLAARKTETGQDFIQINPRGYVPALQIDGELHTEVVALVQHIAEMGSPSALLPMAGSVERHQVNEWLAFVSSELHRTIAPWLFSAETAESTKKSVLAKFAKRLAELDSLFARRPYLTGDSFTVADAYAFTILSWSKFLKIDLRPYPNLSAFTERVARRPKVREALEAEGLVDVAA